MADTGWAVLWGGVAAGDGDVFAEFYLRHAGRVFSHCYRSLNSREDAENLVAEVFATACRRRRRVTVHKETV